MRFQRLKFIQLVCLPALTSTAWAHPAVHDGSPLSNLIHLLTQPDHLLILAGIGVAAGILWRWWVKKRLLP